MLRLIYTQDSDTRDAIIQALGLEKKSDTIYHVSIYQQGEWILGFSRTETIAIVIGLLLEEYYPDRLYLPFLGRSIDQIHEIGDVVLPNVFMRYDERVGKSDLDAENRDKFLGEARFLEIYREQKDYYVEDYGLSVGGIVVDSVIDDTSDEMNEKLMFAYEADAYILESIGESYDIVLSDIIPTVIAVGIVAGKESDKIKENPKLATMRNIITTWRLMEEE
jgi:hypothetical protein